MRFPLRWRLLLLTVLAPAVLALGTFWYLSGSVTRQVRQDIDDSLTRAALMFEKQLSERVDALAVTGRVIARDPRFFSAVALPGGARSAGARTTMAGVAKDFQQLTHADVFEVLDHDGRVMASVGGVSTSAEGRAKLIASVRPGEEATGLLIESGSHYQVAWIPVRVDGSRAGSLLIGLQIGPSLANDLHLLTRSEVTFVASGACTGSSLPDGPDRQALIASLNGGPAKSAAGRAGAPGAAQWVTLARPLPGSVAGDGQWFVLQRSLAAETEFLRHAQQGLLALALVAVAIAALIGGLTAEGITRPLIQLVRGAEAMERGNYEVPIDSGSGDEIGYLGTRFTEMREHERNYIGKLESVTRLKSRFISVAFHELGTPLTIIKGWNDLFVEGMLGVLTPDQQKAVNGTRESIEHMMQMTENAERLAEIEGGLELFRDEHQLALVVEEAVTLALRDAPGRGLTIERHIDATLGPANVDGQQLMQAVANLVRNAIRFTPDGGRVDVRAFADRAEFVIEVEDDGDGIAPELQQELFSGAYVQVDAMHHHSSKTLEYGSAGLGIGLAIARGIVEKHEGKIVVESAPGAGSTFSIRIPRLTVVRLPATPGAGTAAGAAPTAAAA